MACINKTMEKVNSLDEETIQELIREYKEAKGPADRAECYDKLRLEYINILTTHAEVLAETLAEFLTKVALTSCRFDHARVEYNVVIYLRCETETSLNDLRKLVDSGELGKQFVSMMRSLVGQRVIAYVRISDEDFTVCLTSLTDGID